MKRYMLLIVAATFAWFTGCSDVPTRPIPLSGEFSGTLEVDQAIALPTIEGFEETARLVGKVEWTMDRMSETDNAAYSVRLSFDLGIQPKVEGLAKRYTWIAEGEANGIATIGGGNALVGSYAIKGIQGKYRLAMRFEVREREKSAELVLANAEVFGGE